MVKKIIVFVKSLLIKIILLIKVTLAIVHIIILDINLFVNMTYEYCKKIAGKIY